MNSTLSNRWIADLPTYVAGPGRLKGVAAPIRLAANESALGTSPKVAARLAKMASFSRYPESDGERLREKLAEKHRLDAARIICTNGSDELITMLARGWGGEGKNAVVSEHGFLYYPIACASTGSEVRAVAMTADLKADVKALAAACDGATSLLFLANPNNPTGTVLDETELDELCAAVPPNVLIVIDSAYAEYAAAANYEDGIGLVARFANVVMVRTFSKIYGLAGLRIGWGYSRAENIAVLNKLRPPFNLNSAAQEAAITALADEQFTAEVKTHTLGWRQRLTAELEGLGVRVTPSAANFLLVGCGRAAAVVAKLAAANVLVRELTPMGLPNHFRVAIGSDYEMEKFLAAFRHILKSG